MCRYLTRRAIVQVRELETAIRATIAEINEAEAALKDALDPKDIDYLRAKVLLLMDEELAFLKELASACTLSRLFRLYSSSAIPDMYFIFFV